MKITSLTNEKVKFWNSLNLPSQRVKNKKYIVDGDHLVIEAFKLNCLDTLIYNDFLPKELESFSNKYQVTNEIMKKISNVSNFKNIIGVCNYTKGSLQNIDSYIALDDVQDPGNGGTILRSALAFGFKGMLISLNSFDQYNTKFIRATMGAFFNLPVLKVDLYESLIKLKNDGYKIISADLNNDSINIEELPFLDKFVVVVGSEGNGVSQNIIGISDYILKINMNSKVESLNVGVAASIIMHHIFEGKLLKNE
ncbi:MAG: RNA methyltransferase [Bacilli bacterium]|nr:RNA methyltransferase [Bacilli bacterium]